MTTAKQKSIRYSRNPSRRSKSIGRRSQITGKPPPPRLKSRRRKVARRHVKGYWPNPKRYIVERDSISMRGKRLAWVFLRAFDTREAAFKFARDYVYPRGKYSGRVRVIRK